MSIQWTIAASFLYFEIAIVLILVLPVFSPRRWQNIFQSRFLAALRSQAQVYFYILLFTLVLLLLDAVREMRKYSNHDDKDRNHSQQLDHEMQINMRLFRAQRNFYISGFALFLSLVIRRLVTLVSSLASLQAQSEASLKQAEGASKAARNILSQRGVTDENATNEAHDKQVNELKAQITELKNNLDKEKKDKDALKKQAESTNTEYDRLTEEYSKLQKKVDAQAAAAVTSSGDKKDD